MLSKNTMLFQILCGVDGENAQIKTYWTIVSLDETIQDVPDNLRAALERNLDPGARGGIDGVFKNLGLCTMGSIHRLAIFQTSFVLQKPKFPAEAPRSLIQSEPYLQVCELVQDGKLLREH